jgi:hypothetical protein
MSTCCTISLESGMKLVNKGTGVGCACHCVQLLKASADNDALREEARDRALRDAGANAQVKVTCTALALRQHLHCYLYLTCNC